MSNTCCSVSVREAGTYAGSGGGLVGFARAMRNGVAAATVWDVAVRGR